MALDEEAFPFEEKAIGVHEKNMEMLRAGVFNAWTEKSLGRLARADAGPLRETGSEQRLPRRDRQLCVSHRPRRRLTPPPSLTTAAGAIPVRRRNAAPTTETHGVSHAECASRTRADDSDRPTAIAWVAGCLRPGCVPSAAHAVRSRATLAGDEQAGATPAAAGRWTSTQDAGGFTITQRVRGRRRRARRLRGGGAHAAGGAVRAGHRPAAQGDRTGARH